MTGNTTGLGDIVSLIHHPVQNRLYKPKHIVERNREINLVR